MTWVYSTWVYSLFLLHNSHNHTFTTTSEHIAMIQHQIEFKNEDETMAISKSLFSLARDYSYKLLFLFLLQYHYTRQMYVPDWVLIQPPWAASVGSGACRWGWSGTGRPRRRRGTGTGRSSSRTAAPRMTTSPPTTCTSDPSESTQGKAEMHGYKWCMSNSPSFCTMW